MNHYTNDENKFVVISEHSRISMIKER
jgi:hypothetical protein